MSVRPEASNSARSQDHLLLEHAMPLPAGKMLKRSDQELCFGYGQSASPDLCISLAGNSEAFLLLSVLMSPESPCMTTHATVPVLRDPPSLQVVKTQFRFAHSHCLRRLSFGKLCLLPYRDYHISAEDRQ